MRLMGTVVISAFEHTVKDQIKTDAKLSRPYGPPKKSNGNRTETVQRNELQRKKKRQIPSRKVQKRRKSNQSWSSTIGPVCL